MKADIDQLRRAGAFVHGLAEKSGNEKVASSGPFSAGAEGVLPAVTAAADFCHQLVEGALIPTITERLHGTGDVMIDIAEAYKSRDDSTADAMVSAYTNALGEWSAQEPA